MGVKPRGRCWSWEEPGLGLTTPSGPRTKLAFQDSCNISLDISASREEAGRFGYGFCDFFIGSGMDIVL